MAENHKSVPEGDPGGTAQSRGFSRRLFLLAAVFLFIFMGAGAQQAYLVPYLGRVTGWSTVRCSTIVAAVYLSMLVFRTLNVYLFPRWTDRRLTITGSLAYLMFTIVMYATASLRSYPIALVAALAWGAGGAMMWTGTTMQTLKLADEAGGRHGTGMGVLYTSTHAGWLAGVIGLGLVYKALPTAELQRLYLPAAACTLAGNILAFRLPATSRALRETPRPGALLAAIVRPRALIAGILQLTSALAFGLVLGSLGAIVQEMYGPQWIWITLCFYPGTRMVLALVGGIAADRIGHGRILFGSFLAGAAGLGLAVLWQSPYAMILTAFTLGLLSSTVPVVASAIVGHATDPQRRPIIYGIIFSWRDLGVVVAALGVNLLGFRFDFQTAFTVFSIVFVACAVLALGLERYAHQRL